MKKAILAAVVALPMLFSFAPAHAGTPDDCFNSNGTIDPESCAFDGGSRNAVGFTCGFTSSDDPTGAVGQPGQQIGEVDGGPVAVADLPTVDDTVTPPAVSVTGGNPESGTITCAIQVGGTGVYTDADAASASASGTAVVYLPPTEITYFAAPTDNVWSCTTWVVADAAGGSDTLYLDDTTGEFVTDPAAAHCALAISQEVTPPPTA
jgi:type 1 fimbria pilin